uniref:Uncharacterized protein n=1 Tax=Sphaerodactylus townsendi TaxID=933632 RepID=A0ACB8FXZ3_9SAUR
MSAVVQELYAELPVALSAELTALSDPKIVLDVQAEASAFVLTCSSDLPSEHQRNYGLKICSQNSDERLDCTGKISCSGQMELISEEPAVNGALVEDAEVQNKCLLKKESLCKNLRESAKVAENTKDVAEYGLVRYSQTPQENGCSKWEQSQLNQEEGEFVSVSSFAEIADFVQNLEENPANMQMTTESLPDSIKEAQGMKADGTRLFRERNTRVGTGVPPERSECSNVDNVMAKVEVSKNSTLFSHKPANVMDNAFSEEHPQKVDTPQEMTAHTVLSATLGTCVLSGSEAGGETSFNQYKDAYPTLNDNLPFQQDTKNLHNNLPIPVSERLVAIDDQLSDMSSEASSVHFKSCLEFGSVLWEDNLKPSEVMCEIQEECPLGKEDSLKSNTSSEAIELLEVWASDINMKIVSPAWSNEDPSADDEQEISIYKEHSYSSVCKESSECQTSNEHLEDYIRPVLSETDSTQKEMDQLCAFLNDRCMAIEMEENRSFLMEASNIVCKQETSGGLQNSSIVNINSIPTYHDSLGDDTKLCQGFLLKIESNSDTRKGVLSNASATHLHATNSTFIIGTNLGTHEEDHKRIQLSDEHSFTQQSDATFSSTEFLDSLPGEELLGLCAKLQPSSTDCRLHHRRKLPSTNQKCSSCILTRVPSKLNDATANTKEGEGLEMSCASVPLRTAGPPKEPDVKECDCPPDESSWDHLHSACYVGVSGTGLSQADSLEFHLEDENQRANDGGGVNAEEILNADISSCSLETNLEQELIKASLEINDRMEMMKSVKANKISFGNSRNEKSAGGRDLNKTVRPLKFHSFKKGQGHKELENYKVHLYSSSSDDFSLKRDLISDHIDYTKQQEHPILNKNPGSLQMRVQALACQDYHLHSLDPFKQKNVIPKEIRVLACQQHDLVISKRQKGDNTIQTVNHSLEEPVIFSQDELVCPKRDQDTTLQIHPVLLTKNGGRETFQSCMRGNSSWYKKGSELISNPLKGRLIKLNNTGILLECLGLVSELLKSNRFIQKWGRQRTTGFCSVLRSVRRRSLEMRNRKCFLKVSGKPRLLPNHRSLLLKSLMFTTAGGQRTMEGVYSKLFKDSFTYISLGMQPAQNSVSCLPQKDEPSTSLTLNVFDSSVAAVSLERRADDYIHLVFPEDSKSCCSVKGVVYVGCLPGSKEILVSTMHSMPGVKVIGEILSITFSGLELSKKIKQSSDNNQGQRSIITEETKIPIHLLSKDSSTALLDVLLVGKEEIIIPFNSEIYTRPSFSHPLECISELSLNEGHPHAKDPFKPAIVKQQVLQLKDVFSSIILGTVSSTMPCPSLSVSMFEALAKWLSSQEKNLQTTEKQARDQRKALDYLVNISSEIPAYKTIPERGNSPTFMKNTTEEEMEQSLAECTTFSDAGSQQWGPKDKGEAENLFRQRSIRIGYFSASSCNTAVALSAGKPEDSTWTLLVGSIVENNEDKHPCSTLRDSKRPKRSKELIVFDYMEAKDLEARGPSLCFRNQQSTSVDIPVAPILCTWSQVSGFWLGGIQVGNAHKISQSLPLRRKSGNMCKKGCMQAHFKVRRKSSQIKSSAFLKHLLEIVPNNKFKLISSVHLAMKSAATENKAAVMWGPTPTQRANQNSLVNISRVSGHTKDPAVLKRLSALAYNLLVPSTNPQMFKLSMKSKDLFPITEQNSQLRRKKLLKVFSWVNMKLNSPWIKGSKYSTKMFNSQSLALYTVDSRNVSGIEPSNRIPLTSSTPTFPISFHIEMGSSPVWSTLGITSLHSVTNRMASGEPEVCQPSKWTFSSHLSQSSLGEFPVYESPCISAESGIASAPLHAAKDSRRYAVAQRSPGCSMLGLQTVLALSSPGCYRVWTRERNLTSRIPAIQRLTVLQFAQGLKGLKCSSSVSADLFSSLPYLLGRALSIWSQHGPSTCPTEFTLLHSNRCKWQPVTTATTSLGLGNR